MKFANLTLDKHVEMVNVGDYIQILAIENLYQYMKIQEEIVKIPISQLSNYDGEYVILPINYPFYGFYNLSEKIIPVYLGISIMSKAAGQGLKFKNYEPIGCRDMHTFMEIKKLDIDAYVGGCLTIALPYEGWNVYTESDFCEEKKVFLVDVPQNIMPYMPERYKKQSIVTSQVHYFQDCLDEDGAKKLLNRYKKEASLVITSRIHCAMPCIAMGLPVIFVCEFNSFRYQVLQNLIPIYTKDNFSSIDWNPQPIYMEERKILMLENAKERVLETYNKYNKRCNISQLYENKNSKIFKIDTVSVIEDYIERRWNSESTFSYVLWGVTQIAEIVFEYITKNYPRAKMEAIIDMYREVNFHGIESCKEDILQQCESVVFVTAGSAIPIAEELLKKYKIEQYLINYNGKCIEDGQEKRL